MTQVLFHAAMALSVLLVVMWLIHQPREEPRVDDDTLERLRLQAEGTRTRDKGWRKAKP